MQPMSKEIMTLWYRAPEVLLSNLEYTKAIDLWSVGIIIFELLTGRNLFEATSEIDMLFKIFWLKGTPCGDYDGVKSHSSTQIKNHKSYALLVKYASMLPKFKPQPLESLLPSNLDLGSNK